MRFSAILCDPPWQYKDRGCNGAAQKQYQTMPISQIKSLPIADICADDCALFLWGTWPLLPQALDVMESYSFQFVSIAFLWVKTYQRAEVDQARLFPEEQFYSDSFFGLGRWTRGNSEFCLLGKRGKPKRVNNSVHQLVYSPVGKHSEKPAEVRERIVKLMGDVPRIEIFARQRVPGWHCAGNGVSGKDIRVELAEIAKLK